jgi:hypothetical protein
MAGLSHDQLVSEHKQMQIQLKFLGESIFEAAYEL